MDSQSGSRVDRTVLKLDPERRFDRFGTSRSGSSNTRFMVLGTAFRQVHLPPRTTLWLVWSDRLCCSQVSWNGFS